MANSRFQVFTVPGAAVEFGIALEELESIIEQGGIEVFRVAGARCVRASDVAELARRIKEGPLCD